MATTVTIIGAGLGGIALVANLGLLGYRLRLHDRDEARIARVRGLAKKTALQDLMRPAHRQWRARA
jgi:2-polyprenyl-6-methoxyphenol hydroxylase-like FAD-dependent oxidoreductase